MDGPLVQLIYGLSCESALHKQGGNHGKAGMAAALGTIHLRRRHVLGGGGVKNWPNLPTDSSKKLPTEGGRGQKS